MTYDAGWLKKRVSTAATEYNKWTPSLKEAIKLTSNDSKSEPVVEPKHN